MGNDTRDDGSRPDPVLSPLTVAQAERLVRLAEAAAAERGHPMKYDGAGALVPVADDGALETGGVFAGLANLARAVAAVPRQRWRAAVATHFAQMTAGPPPDLPDDLDRELYLRLVCAATIQPRWRAQVPEFVPGVLTVPASYVERSVAMHFETGHLEQSRDELSRIGLANLRRLRDTVELVEYDGARVAVLGDSMFTASRALVLDTVLRESLKVENPSFGVLVAMPVRDMLLVHVLRDQTVVAALDLMVSVATHAFGSQPGPVSPHVYYVADDRWHQVTDHSSGEVRVQVDGALRDAVRRLGVLDA
jgi:hypothetical protein